jgi:hypothetical protein
MKLTSIIGTLVAAIGLAACGSTVVPPTSPTGTPTVATPTATTTATAIPTSSPSGSSSPNASASPSPTDGPCGFQACGTGVGWNTTCAVPGSAQGGSLIVTWTAGAGQTAPVVPDTITVDGNTLDVTSNPFTSGPYLVGAHAFTYPGAPEGPNGGSMFPFTISACASG